MRTATTKPAIVAFLLALICSCLFVPAAFASDKKNTKEYALIVGTVWTPEQHAAYGVHVFMRRADQKKPFWEGYSDHNGEFAVRVPAGKADYIVWADLKKPKGAKAKARPETTVHIENDERTEVGLHLTE